MTATRTDEDLDLWLETAEDPPPCAGRPRNKPKCGKPSTHDILLSCGPCGYTAVRHLCTRHAIKAQTMRWWCKICRSTLSTLVTPRP